VNLGPGVAGLIKELRPRVIPNWIALPHGPRPHLARGPAMKPNSILSGRLGKELQPPKSKTTAKEELGKPFRFFDQPHSPTPSEGPG